MKCLLDGFVAAWLCVLLVASPGRACEGVTATETAFNVAKYGTKGNGREKDTAAVQSAIDTCSQRGGGTVYFPPGKYLCGSLHLRSDIALYLDHGATIIM